MSACGSWRRPIGQHESYVHRLAKQRGWRRPSAGGEERAQASPPSPELAEIVAGLCDPHLTRSGLIRLVERLAALTTLDVLLHFDAGVERRAALLPMLARLARDLPEDAPPAAGRRLSPEEEEREQQAVIEELVRRFSSFDEGGRDESGWDEAAWDEGGRDEGGAATGAGLSRPTRPSMRATSRDCLARRKLASLARAATRRPRHGGLSWAAWSTTHMLRACWVL